MSVFSVCLHHKHCIRSGYHKIKPQAPTPASPMGVTLGQYWLICGYGFTVRGLGFRVAGYGGNIGVTL